MTANRVPAGVPTGGQFAASVHAEPDGVSLTGERHLALVPAPDDAPDFDVREPADDMVDEVEQTTLPEEPEMGPDNPWAPHYKFPDYVPGEPPSDDPDGESAALDCPNCSGSGEVDTGRREYDTNAAITTTCGYCGGEGTVDLDGMADYATWAQAEADAEPDYEQMKADRDEARYGGHRDAVEWGGMDIPS